MKILFAPSEAKNELSQGAPLNAKQLIFQELFNERKKVLEIYNDYILNADTNALCALFGLKSEKEALSFKKDIFKAPCAKAIEIYSGVSFKHLNYQNLSQNAQKYIDENLIIFSNLFGPLSAKDHIPCYKLKQGAKIKDLNIESFYKKHFSKALDALLQDECVLDLRAGFYEKFYTLNKPYYTYKFIKQGKVISHFAKAYRGELARVCALKNIKDNESLLANLPSNLRPLELKKMGLKEEISLEILD